ncbi:formyltransferase family protein [Defluviimonas sp. D31]|uniref:methionyl-tRNA formyltransferase n=1 Tax=Defluviimonas sp. D31 TaxID=3083253 RepID=UPI00296E8879|nr:formyltransferase family protein [Defluviimonas sp. D31]MDW4549729.1 formyltransferase family protein [Defluviimonas sp. D31]
MLVITEDDPLYVIEFFKVFFDELPAGDAEVIGVTVDQAFHEPILKTLKRMLSLYGWTGVFRLGLRYVWAKMRGDTIAAMARRRGLPLLETPSVNDPAYLARIRDLRPDVIMSVAGPEIFSAGLLSSARLGCINIHSGRLPTYRGMLPTFWQLLRGESAVTITVHRMVEELDAGDVLATAPFPLRERDSLDRVMRGAKREGARLFVRVLRDLREGKAKGAPLDMGEAGYFRFPTPEDARAFRRLGHRLL